MAKFEPAYKILEQIEGVYSNNPLDKGGETFRGISRKYNPSWIGWAVIDVIKIKNVSFNSINEIQYNKPLQELAQEFYKKKYWDFYGLDTVEDQDVADEIFESSVNLGRSTTTRFLQKSLNLLNRNQTLYRDLVVDGKMGRKTKSALFLCIKNKDAKYLYNMLNILQGHKYISIANETFIRGWLNRVKIKN